MPQIKIPWPDVPQEVKDQLITVMKDKLPTPVDDAILNDIIETHIQIMKEYLKSM